jgi:hypothetical protein
MEVVILVDFMGNELSGLDAAAQRLRFYGLV